MRKQLSLFISILLMSVVLYASADDFDSSSFRVSDPVLFSGQFSTSTGFQLFGSLSETLIGTTTSANFGINTGFLYFPFVSTPIVSATPGDGEADLSWTASQGFLGWTVSGYNVGQSTTSGGPYSYTSLGSVTNTTVTGLTNGIEYFFIIRPEDAFGVTIATSSEISVTPSGVVPPPPPPPPPPGGGGGPVETAVEFSGRAYPGSTVTFLKDAQVSITTVAGGTADFFTRIGDLAAGNYIFSVYSEDNAGRRSSLLSFPVSVTEGTTTKVSGIFIAPTIAVDKSEVKKGDPVAIFGQSVPNAEVTIVVNSEESFFVKTDADTDGTYLYNFNTAPLEEGDHTTQSRSAIANEISTLSRSVSFLVGDRTKEAGDFTCPQRADLNDDCRVNLVDFSIAAFWHERTLSDSFAALEKEELNGDGIIDLVDFSIMAFYWTG